MTSGRLAGKVCIVTGGGTPAGGTGNGSATAIRFAEEGGRVVVVDRDADACARTVTLIEQNGGQAVAAVGDVTNVDDARAAVDLALHHWGRVDVLHNNVGIAANGDVVTHDIDAWHRIMNVNVTSILLMSRFAVPAMVRGGGGAVVNISSISALRPRGQAAYSASKGAVIALTRAMATDHGPDGVRVNCIAPGPIYTPHVVAQGVTPEARERRRLASVLQREGTPWDVANAAVYLASDEARYVTGVVLPVDGGVSIRGPAR